MTNNSSSTSGIFYFIVVNLVSNGSSFLFFIIIARMLPDISGLGLVTILQTIITTTAIIAGLGLPQTASRFISNYIGSGDKESANETLKYIVKLGFSSSIAVSIILFVLAPNISTFFLHAEQDFVIRLAALDSFFLSMSNFGFYSLSALQRYRKIAIISAIGTAIKFSTAFLLVFIGSGLQGIFLGFIVGDAITTLLYVAHLLPTLRIHSKAVYSKKEILRYSIPWYGSSILAFVAEVIDRYLLQLLSGLIAVGFYTPAILLGAILRILLSSLEQALLPSLSREFGKNGIHSLASSTRVVSRYLFLIYIPIGFLIIATLPVIIPWIYGERYAESIVPTAVIVLGFTLPSIGYVFNASLLSSGHSRVFLASSAIGLFIQILLGIILIPHLSATGAAIARSAAFGIMTIYPAFKLRGQGGFSYDKPSLVKGITGSAIMTLIILVTIQIVKEPFIVIPVIIMGTIVYLLFLRLTKGLVNEDIVFLNDLTGNKLGGIMRVIQKIAISNTEKK